MTKAAEAPGLAAYRLRIGGRETPAGGGSFLSVNPTTGDPWAEIGQASSEDVDAAVAAAATAFVDQSWRGLSPTRRGRLLMRLGDRIAEHAEELAVIETRDNGKLYREMALQLSLVRDWLYYFGGLADKVEGRVIPLDRQSVLNYTLREPLGVVGIITPWNSPTFLTLMTAAPALAAGNTVVVKPSDVTSASILEIARLTEDAGFPPGVVNVVTGRGSVGARLVEHPDVAKVAFTGGTETGRRIAEAVGRRLGRSLLELGGKSANIVFADADLDAAEAGVLAGIFAAGGQTCVAGSRALVDASIFDELVDRLVRRAQAIRLGDPMRPETEMGPIALQPQLERVETMVGQAKAEGAEVLCGGDRAHLPDFPRGFFYRPTVLAPVGPSQHIVQEEVFGPVLAVLPFEGEEHAVALANDSRYGLAAGVWTNSIKRAHRVARRLEAGTIWINMYRALAFNSPFGGYKDSGIGRQNGIEAIGEYLQTKSVWCELGDEIQDPFSMRA